jgi:hypothetical protein
MILSLFDQQQRRKEVCTTPCGYRSGNAEEILDYFVVGGLGIVTAHAEKMLGSDVGIESIPVKALATRRVQLAECALGDAEMDVSRPVS